MLTPRFVPRRHTSPAPISVVTIALALSTAQPLPVSAASAPGQSASMQQIKSDAAAQVVGAAIRRRGHTCAGSIEATPVERPVKAHHKTWRLACGDDRYLVTFVLDRMVVVERLD